MKDETKSKGLTSLITLFGVGALMLVTQTLSASDAFLLSTRQTSHHPQVKHTTSSSSRNDPTIPVSKSCLLLASSSVKSTKGTTNSDSKKKLDANLDTDSINGLLDQDEFQHLQRFDSTLQKLQEQIPYLLETGLMINERIELYTPNFFLQIVGENYDSRSSSSSEGTTVRPGSRDSIRRQESSDSIVLLDGRNELLALSSALVSATSVARQAAQVLRWGGGTSASSSSSLESLLDFGVASRIIIEHSNTDEIIVDWNTKLIPLDATNVASAPFAVQRRRICGLSKLKLNPYSGRIESHELCRITLLEKDQDGMMQPSPTSGGNSGETRLDPKLIAQSLSRVRNVVKSVQASPLLSPLTSVFTELQESAVTNSLGNVDRTAGTRQVPQIYVLKEGSIDSFLQSQSVGSLSSTSLIPIDDFVASDTATSTTTDASFTATPLPGSKSFGKYARRHRALTSFCRNGILVLERGGSNMVDLFDLDQVELLGIDGKSIATGNAVASFYRTMASIRSVGTGSSPKVATDREETTSGAAISEWTLERLWVDWEFASVTVEWSSQFASPLGIRQSLQVTGMDRFALSTETGRIVKVEQLAWTVGGTLVEDPEWFKRFYQAIDLGRNNVLGADLILDLLDQVNTVAKPLSPSQSEDYNDGKDTSCLLLNKEAAATCYRLMCQLQSDLEHWDDQEHMFVPGNQFLAKERVELRGYLNELLVQGDASQYRQAVGGIGLPTLRRTVRQEEPPKVSVSLASPRSVRVTVDTRVSLRSPIPDFGSVMGTGGSNAGSERPSSPFPSTRVQFTSLYDLNEKGQIAVHRLFETRINGQLTPGDVLSKWIKGGRGDSSSSGPVNAIQEASSRLTSILAETLIGWNRGTGSGSNGSISDQVRKERRN